MLRLDFQADDYAAKDYQIDLEDVMGFRICYLASEAPPEVLVEKLGLNHGDQTDEMPDGDWWTAKLKSSGWTILWSEDEGFGQSAKEQVAELSQKHRTYICEVNETCMWSSSELWQNGQQFWRVTHAGDGEDRFDLTEIGQLPEAFAELKQRHFQTQKTTDENVDYIFEIPLDLPALEIGFRHEDHLEAEDVEAFNIIFPNEPEKKPSLLSRIFGR